MNHGTRTHKTGKKDPQPSASLLSIVNSPGWSLVSLKVRTIANSGVLFAESIAEKVKAVALVDTLTPVTNSRRDRNTTFGVNAGRLTVAVHVVE